MQGICKVTDKWNISLRVFIPCSNPRYYVFSQRQRGKKQKLKISKKEKYEKCLFFPDYVRGTFFCQQCCIDCLMFRLKSENFQKRWICKILFSRKNQFRLTQPSVIFIEIVASKTIWEFPTEIRTRFLKLTICCFGGYTTWMKKECNNWFYSIIFFVKNDVFWWLCKHSRFFFINYRSTNNLLLAWYQKG